ERRFERIVPTRSIEIGFVSWARALRTGRSSRTPSISGGSSRSHAWRAACPARAEPATFEEDMIESLKTRSVGKRPDRGRFQGRILFLVDDAELIRRQLAGEDLATTGKAPLRDNISTDEITPAYICYYYDETLGDFPYLGLRAGSDFPISRGSVKAGGFVCS